MLRLRVQPVYEHRSQPSSFLPAGHRCLFQSQRVMRSVFMFSCLLVQCRFSFWLRMFDIIIAIIIPIQAFLTQLVCHLLDEGNSCYRDGDWQQATQQYSEGISVARYAQAEALVIPYELLECLYVNRAAAFYQAVRQSTIFTAI